MDKSRITVTIDAPREKSSPSFQREDRFHVPLPSGQEEISPRGHVASPFAKRILGKNKPPFMRTRGGYHVPSSPGTPSWKDILLFLWKPLLLACVAGSILGMGVLFLFSGGKSEPTVTTIPASGKTSPQGQADFPAVSLYLYQVGVYKDTDAVKKAQSALEGKGVHGVARGRDPISLIAAVSPDKIQGQKLADLLNKMDVNYYGKTMEIPPRKGVITGLDSGTATALSSYVTAALPLADKLVLLAVQDTTDQGMIQRVKQQADDIGKTYQAALQGLQKGKRNWEANILEEMQKSLLTAIELAGKQENIWAVQANLAAFYIGYENLSASLFTTP